jgi:pilus assembly protein CpaC
VRNLQRIAAICVVGVMWGTSAALAEPLPSATSPEVPRVIIESPMVDAASSVNAITVDQFGNPAKQAQQTNGTPPAAEAATSQAPAQSTAPIRKMIGIINGPDQAGAQQADSMPNAEENLTNDQVIFDAVKQLGAAQKLDEYQFDANHAPTPATNAQTAASVPMDAYELESTPAANKPAKRVQIPVEPLAKAGVAAGTDQFELALNKTRAVDLERDVRDVIIGNPDIADIVVRAPGEVYLIGRAVGVTNVFLVDANGNLIRKLEVVVQPDGESVQAAIAQLLPKERIEAKGVGDSIVLSGVASTGSAAAQAQQIARRFVRADANVVNMMTIGSEQQVLIKVKVAEIQKSVLKELGASNLLAPQTLGPLTLDFAAAATGLSSSVFAGTLGLGIGNDLDATFQLLETQGLLRTLAEPNLLAVSGEPASMLAGGEYPVVAVSDDGADSTVSVEYKPFGVSLAFLPVVMGPGRIWLKVSTEVSALSQQNSVVIPFGDDSFQILGLQTRRANSTIELPSGGGIMIAGLLQNDIQSTVNGVPGLMDLPILGSLFRSTSFQRNETELVILVSVILAKPVDPDLLATPTDGFAPSHDLDRYFIGNLQNIYVKRPDPASMPQEGPKGPIGYIIN